jgi:hypothetical protein
VRLTRTQVLAHRVRVQQLDREHGTVGDTSVLDLGVQDTGGDGARWALANRGLRDVPDDALVLLWTLRGAPHVYRRADLASVARAVQPFSDADAGKRIYDASKPLKAAGIGNLEALDTVAAEMRSLVTALTGKHEVSRLLNERMPAPYLRECRPCKAIHVYEMPFRLAALRAGLALQPGTSPPVLGPVPGFAMADEAEPRHDVVRAVLHLLGPTTPQLVAGFLDAAVADVKQRWPADAVAVELDGQRREALEADLPSLEQGPVETVRLLGPYDLFLQGRDRDLLVPDRERAKRLWPVLGRPGAVLVDGEVAGLWRPRQSGGRLRLQVEAWAALPDLDEQAQRLASARGVALAGVEKTG